MCGVGEGFCAVFVVLCFSFGRGGGKSCCGREEARQNGRSGSRPPPAAKTAKGTYVSPSPECTQEKHREQEGFICMRKVRTESINYPLSTCLAFAAVVVCKVNTHDTTNRAEPQRPHLTGASTHYNCNYFFSCCLLVILSSLHEITHPQNMKYC